jgi:steroid delta-isomerase-like uncharacterized protein
MSTDANKALIRSHYDRLVNRHDLTAADEQLAPDFVDHGAPPGKPNRGPEAAKLAMAALHAGMPDVHVTLDDVVADGDRVAVRATWRGTHTGPLFGVPASGNAVTITGMVFWRIAGGKIVERWATVDLGALHRAP